ncbi:DUF2510 domain-containing protein [Nocardioides stalactiti]|uniref:DUF2510 domain-containing protein n=1 Tax=Nocardioides stalactiti TaxID=2755356 RepID=UPI001602A6A9|nr:DUF2510 domain-containing protein [Nocardioides stalactiti]
MTHAGWYPDPSGQPQTYRYWDGSSWSEQTSGDPYATPPVADAPPAPPPTMPTTMAPTPAPPSAPVPPAPPTPYGQQAAYGQVPPPPSAGGYGQPAPAFPPSPNGGNVRNPRLLIALVVGVLTLFLVLAAAGFIVFATTGDDTKDADDTSATDGTSPEPPTPPTPPTSPTAPDTTAPTDTTTTDGTETTAQQCLGGRPRPAVDPAADAQQISTSGLTIPVPDGYAPETAYAPAFTFANAFIPLQMAIEEGSEYGWVSIYGIGGVEKANGFTDPAQAAEVVMTCMAASPELYRGFSGRTDLSSGPVTIDGTPGFQVTAELRVDDPNITLEGDVAQVVVVDTGDAETFGLYITVVPIGDDALIAQQAAFLDRITVD